MACSKELHSSAVVSICTSAKNALSLILLAQLLPGTHCGFAEPAVASCRVRGASQTAAFAANSLVGKRAVQNAAADPDSSASSFSYITEAALCKMLPRCNPDPRKSPDAQTNLLILLRQQQKSKI